MATLKNISPAKSPLPRGPHAISTDAVAGDQRRRLLEALPQAIAANGFEATTVEDIVKLAQVRRNSFYEQFENKLDCFSAAYEIAQEKLLGVLTFQCYTRVGSAERIDAALGAGLELLGGDPTLARLIVVEAPAAGAGLAARHHEWLDRYGRLLRLASLGDEDAAAPRLEIEPAVIGGIVSRIKQLVLAGETLELPELRSELLQFALSFYGSPRAPAVPEPVATRDDQDEPAQPQSPERSTVLEPA